MLWVDERPEVLSVEMGEVEMEFKKSAASPLYNATAPMLFGNIRKTILDNAAAMVVAKVHKLLDKISAELTKKNHWPVLLQLMDLEDAEIPFAPSPPSAPAEPANANANANAKTPPSKSLGTLSAAAAGAPDTPPSPTPQAPQAPSSPPPAARSIAPASASVTASPVKKGPAPGAATHGAPTWWDALGLAKFQHNAHQHGHGAGAGPNARSAAAARAPTSEPASPATPTMQVNSWRLSRVEPEPMDEEGEGWEEDEMVNAAEAQHLARLAAQHSCEFGGGETVHALLGSRGGRIDRLSSSSEPVEPVERRGSLFNWSQRPQSARRDYSKAPTSP